MGLFKKNTEAVLQGKNIYKDKHNRYVYYRKSNKTGYVVTPDKYQSFQMMSMRYILGITATALIYSFHIDIWIAGTIGLILIGILEFQFRFRMLPNLTQIPNFDTSNKAGVIENLACKANTPKLIILGILYLAFAILFVLLGIEQNYRELPIWLCIGVICIGAIYYAILHFLAAAYKKSHPEIKVEKDIKLKIKK